MIKRYLYLLVPACLVGACAKKPAEMLFQQMPAATTGIYFENRVQDTDTLNILDYLYYYNGGGVALGDFNNDGLADIFFTANQGPNALYLNQGGWRFADITQAAGVAGTGNWKTGVTVADVNADGWLDIYVCAVGGYKQLTGRNQLYINNGPQKGIGQISFTDRAQEYGLDVEGFNTQAVFFDYDRDGDLDMFLVNHSVHSNKSYGDSSIRSQVDAASGDKLFRNDSTAAGWRFLEVTREAGIYSSVVGYGLAVGIADLNNDGWDDIYVSNDFHENDYYYLNNHDGRFTEINREAFGHQSRFSMGSAIADMNNDGWEDIITLDMLPEDEKVLKSSAGDDPYDIYNYKFSYGYHHQYARNCLQLNRGGGRRFSDIGLYAGIAATDWSWTPLAADFDNDGIRDLFITNGILRRPNDLDFIKYYSSRNGQDTSRADDANLLAMMPEGKVANYMYRGNRDLKFINQSQAWGFADPSFSNGAAYADLDNDGDLDIVVNNTNGQAFVYRNNSRERRQGNFLQVQLRGSGHNPGAIGARVTIKTRSGLQTDYLQPTRGFESASLQYLHLGLGADTLVEQLEIAWPNGLRQQWKNLAANRRYVIDDRLPASSSPGLLPWEIPAFAPFFTEVTPETVPVIYHKENEFTDFNREPLIPHMVSTQGPKMAVADLNGDGLDDFYLCGAAGQPGALYLQTANGRFLPHGQKVFALAALSEEVDALFTDVDGNGSPDLYVVCSGNESETDSATCDRLYLNDGRGNFRGAPGLPMLQGNKSVVAAADWDRDGDTDLFVGGRVVAGNYAATPCSYFLENDGRGNFKETNLTGVAGDFRPGRVTGAAWADVDRDGWPDLLLTGEWMHPTYYHNVQGRLVDESVKAGLQPYTGLWNTLAIADINGDGLPDLLAGNRGENNRLQASAQFPLRLFTRDMDQNGIPDLLLTVARSGTYYPFLGKEELEKQIPGLLRKKYRDYRSFAGQSITAILGNDTGETPLEAATLASACFINNGKGGFTMQALPTEQQWSPLFAFCPADFNGDGMTDLLTGGNFFEVQPYEGRYDAGIGGLLVGNNKLGWQQPRMQQTGLCLTGAVRDIKLLRQAQGRHLIAVAQNNDRVRWYRVNGE